MVNCSMDVQPSSVVVHEMEVYTPLYANSRAEAPGNDLNMHHQLLKDELDTLWLPGAVLGCRPRRVLPSKSFVVSNGQ